MTIPERNRLADLKRMSDDQLLNELFVCEPSGNEAEQLRMMLFARKTDALAAAITTASRAGRWLAWVVGAASVASAVVAVMQLVYGR